MPQSLEHESVTLHTWRSTSQPVLRQMLVRLNDFSNYFRKPVTMIFDLHVAQWGLLSAKVMASSPEMRLMLIAKLEGDEHDPSEPSKPQPSARLTNDERAVQSITSGVLAAELQRRGWIVMEP